MGTVTRWVLAAAWAVAAFGGPALAGQGDLMATITDTSASPYAKLQSVPLSQVTLDDAFWRPRLETNRRQGIPHQFRECERTGRIDNFRRAAGLPTLHPYVKRSSQWGISFKEPGHPIFQGLPSPLYTVSPGVPTEDACVYWDDPSAFHGLWLADWENPGNKVVCGEYRPGRGKVVFVGTGAYFWDTGDTENAFRAHVEQLTRNILGYLGEGAVAFAGAADAETGLDIEGAAAFAWARETVGAQYLSWSTLQGDPSAIDAFQVVWWHYAGKPAVVPAAVEVAPAVRAFLERGGGLFLSGYAPQYVVTLGIESTPPGTVRGSERDGFRGAFFNDSDVYKIMEAVAFSLMSQPDPELEAYLDDLIDLVGQAQQADGYLNTYFMFDQAPNRWKDLVNMHELYCGGHMVQAAVAHRRATGKTAFLDIARKWADHCARRFGPGGQRGACGHPEVELALVELYRETGDVRYLDLAAFFVEERGRGVLNGSPYLQDHRPIREQTELTGHAVRQLYLCAGVADLYAERGDATLMDTLLQQWDDLVTRKEYVTGACGARHEGEAFGEAYELPNASAYAETCANIASTMWNWRMLQIAADARYADAMERALYNSVLSGVSLDATVYFYVNPLEEESGKHRRTSAHFDACACCPPNIARTLAAFPGYLYGTGKDGALYVHHYAQSEADIDLGGRRVRVRQETRYPWEGTVTVTVTPDSPATFPLRLRYPGWAREVRAAVNGVPVDLSSARPGSYLVVEREWRAGDRVTLDLPMPVETVVCHPRVEENRGRVALRRGPVVYCLEQADHPDTPVFDIALPPRPRLEPEFRGDLLGGVVVIRGEGMVPGEGAGLYETMDDTSVEPYRSVEVTAIPYYAWANREPGALRLWVPVAAEGGLSAP